LDAVYLKYVEIFALYRLDNYYVIDDRNLLNTNNTGFTDLKTSQKVPKVAKLCGFQISELSSL
jgi:hypothetical protein